MDNNARADTNALNKTFSYNQNYDWNIINLNQPLF